MKKLTITISLSLFLLAILSFSAIAQEKPVRYLFQNNGGLRISGFGGPHVGFSEVLDEFAVTVGGGGAALFNQKFFIGGYGEGLATEHFVRDLSIYHPLSQTNHYYNRMQVSFGHGGLWMGYIHEYQKLAHLGFSARLGAGGIGLNYPGFHSDRSESIMTDVVFVFTPQIELEINLLQWMKINFGAGYRLVSGVNKDYEFRQTNGEIVTRQFFKSSDFSSPSFSIGLLFGAF